MTAITRVGGVDNFLGETPIWSVADQALWWVNCDQPPQLHLWSPATGIHNFWPMPKRISGFVHKGDGNLLVALADGLYDFDVASRGLALRAASPLPEHVMLHECHCDRQGRFWIGAYDHHYPADRNAAGAGYFRLDGNILTPVIEGIAVANGLAFSPDGRTMYVSLSPKREVAAYDLDPATGEFSNRRIFITLGGGGHIDGATVDQEGGYWLAVVGIGKLHRYRPDGSLERVIALPFSNPTEPTFGSTGLATLYVTSTKMKINPEVPGGHANGGLFAFQPGERGIAETPLVAH